jgi:hypothetical protein
MASRLPAAVNLARSELGRWTGCLTVTVEQWKKKRLDKFETKSK